jgi:hypothetical protein
MFAGPLTVDLVHEQFVNGPPFTPNYLQWQVNEAT